MLLSNLESIPGKTIVEHYGLVQGSTIRAKHLGRDFAAGLKNLVGGAVRTTPHALIEQAVEGTDALCIDEVFLEIAHNPLFVHGISVNATFRVECSAMELVINGKTEQVPDDINATRLIEHLGLQNERLAIEVNREIVPRSTFESHRFKSGDQIEIVRAIGGGAC